MDAFLATMQQVLDYLHTIKITDLIDIAIISYLFYRIILFAKETRAGQVLRGIGLVIFLLWIANVFNLHILAYILSKAVELGFLALVVVFIVALIFNIDTVVSFALPMMAGVAAGCFSSQFIAPNLFGMWQIHKRNKLDAAKRKA